MIVQESDILLAALDRRLQVDRVLALDPLAAVGRSSNAPAGPGEAAPAAPATTTATDLATKFPLGQVITARVVEVPRPDHVVADVGPLRIAMTWPVNSGLAPQPGSDIALRILAHEPMLLFQRADPQVDRSTDAPTRWSTDALSLQPQGARATRFDIPILDIDVAPLPGDEAPPDESAGLPHARTGVFAAQPRNDTARSAPMPADGHATIALDDVIVARHTAVVDGVATALIPKASDDAQQVVSPFVPLVLQGPAWPGQPMEFVIRHHREDEQLDNPVLDHWCGEVVIDLPHLGRVAGHLSLSMQGLRIRLEGDDADTVSAMTAASGELATAFAGTDLRVAALSIGMPAFDSRRPEAPVTRTSVDGHA